MASHSSAASSPVPNTPPFRGRENGAGPYRTQQHADTPEQPPPPPIGAKGKKHQKPQPHAHSQQPHEQRTPRSASALKLSQSRLRLDNTGSPYRSNSLIGGGGSSGALNDYFYSSAGAVQAAGRERDTSRDQHGNRWHAHAFPTRVESLRDVHALVDLVDDRGGWYDDHALNEDTAREHVQRAPKKVRAALQEYYDSQIEIIEGFRQGDEILESAFPTEVLRRYGTEQDVEHFIANSRYSQLHLNRLAAADRSDDSDTGYEEDEEEDDEEINARRGSIARAASALSGFWFNAHGNKPPRRKREHSGMSSDDLEESAGLLGRDSTPSRGRRGLSSRAPSSSPYGATAFSSQVPSTTPIAEHGQENVSRLLDPPAQRTNGGRDCSPFSRADGNRNGNGSVNNVDPHARKDSPSGRVVAVESEASVKGGNGRASEDGSLDRKLAEARAEKERELSSREAAVQAAKEKENDKTQARAAVQQDQPQSQPKPRGDGRPSRIIIDSTDEEPDSADTDAARNGGGDAGGIVLDTSGGLSTGEMSGYQPLSHGTSSTTLRASTNVGEADAELKGEPAAEGKTVVPASGGGAGPTGPRPSSSSSKNNDETSNGNTSNQGSSNKWPFRTAVDTLQERERRLLLETVPGKMEKEAELEKGTQFAININLLINILLIAGKGFAVLTSNSVSLIASFVDSVLDLLSTVIIFFTSKAIAYRSAHTVFKYPVGKRRLEPLGVVIFSVLMLTSFSQVFVESVERLLKVMRTGESDGEAATTLPVIGIVFMVITIVVKTLMWLLYRNSRSSGVRALAQDAQNDVVFNIASLLFPVLGSVLKAPALDPIGGIVLSLYIIKEWLETLGSTVTRLSGAVAGKEHLARALYLVTRFRRVKAVSAFELYYSGDEVIAEADVVLPITTPLKEAHDVCEVITYCLEVLDVERAFVHLDYHIHNPVGHLTQRG